MRKIRKKDGRKNKIIVSCRAIIIFSFLIVLISAMTLPLSIADASPKLIYGIAEKYDSSGADGANVVVKASGYPTETTMVSSGSWSVDIGSGTGTEWLDGASFTVTIAMSDGWSGSASGMVSGTYNDVGKVTLYPPELIADAHGPYSGVVDDPIQFFGSAGGDGDYSWEWDFGDGANGTGKTTAHAYSNPGIYAVTLKVADSEDAEDTCETTVLINQSNNPPSKPSISGPITGTKNTEYDYTVLSTDPEGDTVKYSFIWGDQTSYVTESGFLSSGSVFTANHIWTAAGKYTITVTASDNKTTSKTSKLTVLIDAVNVENTGYFIDNDSDGVYDSFHNDTSNKDSDVDYDDGKYLVDDDGDGEWDYTYSMEEGLEPFQGEKEQRETSGFELILVVSTLVLVIFWKRK